jgi:biotin carboxyl carrier protein
MSKPFTIGQYLIEEALPDEYRDRTFSRVMDGKTTNELLSRLAMEQPEKYRETTLKLQQLAVDAQGARGGFSPSIKHVRESKLWRTERERIQRQLKRIYSNPDLSEEQRQGQMLDTLREASSRVSKLVYEDALNTQNPFALQVKTGIKGKVANINNLIGSPLVFANARGKLIPLPVLRGYGKGLRPSEYWAASYGTRKGLVDTKLATADAGYLSKQLSQMTARAVVTDEDDPDTLTDESRGLPVDTDDKDNIGALLARSVAGYPKNTVITAKVLRNLRNKGVQRMMVRSPLVGGPQDGSLYARDVGIRESGRLPVRGENPGMSAASSLAEPISQSAVSSKHSAGVLGAGKDDTIAGFAAINRFIQSPKETSYWAAHAVDDGKVQAVVSAPQGGKYVYVNNAPIYVPIDRDVTVKEGDEVEAGDVLSTGLPNPGVLVEHKGIGEGRRYFTKRFNQLLRDSGVAAHRRNVELVARGLINHVELTEELDAYVPGDTVPYNMLEKFYQPRENSAAMPASKAVGKYLERPVLHYTIGTKVRPSVLKELQEFGLDREVLVNDQPPSFVPHIIRGQAIAAKDPDWLASMQGSGISRRMMEAVHRGHTANLKGTNFVSGIAGDPNFGQPGTGGKIVAPINFLSEMKQKREQAPVNIFDIDGDDDDADYTTV